MNVVHQLRCLLSAAIAACPLASGLWGQYLDFRATEPVPLESDKNGALWAEVPVWPVTPRTLAAESERPIRVMDVGFKGILNAELRARVSATLIGPDFRHGPVLEIRIGPKADAAVLPAGEYTIRLLIEDWAPSAPGATEPPPLQVRELRVLRPAAKLDLPQAYVAVQQVSIFGGTSGIFPPIPVREVGGASGIHELAVRDISQRADFEKVTEARLSASSIAVPAGKTSELHPTTNGVFRYGDNEGRLELFAPEMTEPVVMTYKLRARRSAAFIGVAAVAGMVLGWFSRVWLKRRQEYWEARTAADEVLDAIADVQTQYNDSTLRDELKVLAAALTTQCTIARPSDLLSKSKETNAEVAKRLDAYRTSLVKAREKLQKLRPILPETWDFPLPTKAAIDKVASDLGSLPDKLQMGNATEVESTIKRAIERHAKALYDAGLSWHQEMVRVLGLLSGDTTSLGPEVQLRIRADLAGLPVLPGVLRPNATVDELGAFLVALSDAARFASRLQRLYPDWISESFAPVLVALEGTAKTESLISDLRSAVDALAVALAMIAQDPDGTYQKANVQLGNIACSCQRLLELLDATYRPGIKSLLDQRQYREAALGTIKALKGQGEALGELPNEVGSEQKTGGGLQITSTPEEPRPSTALFPAPAVLAIRRLSSRRAQTSRRLWFVELAKAIAAGAVYLVVIYLASMDNFVGTTKELLLIGLGAFAWDVSLDGAVAKIGSLTK